MKKFIVIQEDTMMFNIFDSEDDFDENGWYQGHEGDDGYHLSEFIEDIVYQADTFEEADEWVQEQLGYEV